MHLVVVAASGDGQGGVVGQEWLPLEPLLTRKHVEFVKVVRGPEVEVEMRENGGAIALIYESPFPSPVGSALSECVSRGSGV